MNHRDPTPATLAAILFLVAPGVVHATFHRAQIHRVIAGVNGFPEAQAIQFRMRAVAQNHWEEAWIRAWDAAGQNPILVSAPTDSVENQAQGDKVLIASAAFSSCTSPPAVPDFLLDELVPPAYFTAGSLTLEDEFGVVWWRLSWGGAGYTGDTTGNAINDDDGDFGPPWPGVLPSSTLQSLRFTGLAADRSTTNLDDYVLTAGEVSFENNAGELFLIVPPPTEAPEPRKPAEFDVVASPNPFRGSTRLRFELPRASRVDLVVTDVRGRRVAEASRMLGAGAQTLDWSAAADDGSPLAAGVYFYRLRVDGGARAGRLVLLQ